jgi:hypothetical protein
MKSLAAVAMDLAAGRLVGLAVVQDVRQLIANPGHPEYAA